MTTPEAIVAGTVAFAFMAVFITIIIVGYLEDKDK